ncbi:hypothetical protein CVT24_002471 [Panaeolus cyanescens]|uniref:Uncharacterized protein n=1 Tax=Panaeolus cyanescens TaxID=181874 RepID=A0A409WV94_9AGAR|nr:hypothetical protein CVT24_002471 [Panaeolus cyanescens]
MPYSHSHAYPRAKDNYYPIQGRVYQAEAAGPHFRNIMTHDNGRQHFALTQSVMHHDVQPYTHFSEAIVMDRRKRHTFYVFFKNHCRLPVNGPIRKLTGQEWRGNMVVMRGSANGEGIVNMRGRDAHLSDFLIKRIVHSIKQGRRVRRPKQLIYTRRS